MKPLSVLHLISAVLITFSCTTLKRYDSVQPAGTDNNLANIDLFGFRLSKPATETGTKTLWDLSADAQSQYIKILNSRYPDNDKFINALSYEYIKQDIDPVPDEYVNKDMRMVFSVSKRRGVGVRNSPPGYNLSSADRIEYLRISLKIPDKNGVRFTGWNMFTTEYGSIRIADVSFSRSLEIDASGLLSAENKMTAGELSAGGKTSATRKEDQGVQYRYLKLNGRIKNNSIEMEEEGTREIDLTGNIVADVTVEFDRIPEILTAISGLHDSTGRFNEPGRLSILNTEVLIPGMDRIDDTIFADLRMDYVFRNVLRGQKTFPEWDDKVKYVTGSINKRIPLLTAEDFVPEFYCIGSNVSPGEREVIRLKSAGNKEFAVIFKSREEALSFHEWLSGYFSKTSGYGKQLKIGEYILKLTGHDLTNDVFTEHQGLKVMPYYL